MALALLMLASVRKDDVAGRGRVSLGRLSHIGRAADAQRVRSALLVECLEEDGARAPHRLAKASDLDSRQRD